MAEFKELDAALMGARDQHMRCLRSILALPLEDTQRHNNHAIRAVRAQIQVFVYLLARDPRARQAISEWKDHAIEAAMAYDELGGDRRIIQISDQGGKHDLTMDSAPNEANVLRQADHDKTMHDLFKATVSVFDAHGAWDE
jgi:hypothetical protein